MVPLPAPCCITRSSLRPRALFSPEARGRVELCQGCLEIAPDPSPTETDTALGSAGWPRNASSSCAALHGELARASSQGPECTTQMPHLEPVTCYEGLRVLWKKGMVGLACSEPSGGLHGGREEPGQEVLGSSVQPLCRELARETAWTLTQRPSTQLSPPPAARLPMR